MSEITIPVPTWRQVKPWLWRVGGIALVLYLAFLVREIWIPLGFALLIALVLDPVVDRMERRGWSRTLGAAVIFGSFLVALVGLLFLSIPAVLNQAGQIEKRVEKYVPDQSPKGVDLALKKQGVPDMTRSIIVRAVETVSSGYTRSSSAITTHFVEIASNLVWLVIIPIVAFYALRDFHLILAKALLLFPASKRELVQSAVAEVTAIFGKYLRGLILVSALNGLATWLLLTILGVPSAFILGIVAGLLYSVPYVGALLTIVLIAAVSLVANGLDFNYMFLVVGCNVVLHQIIFDQLLTPRIVGGHVGLHPIIAIVALLIGNALLGLVGMILAVPIAACIQIGVLAMVPKLRQEIDLAGIETDNPRPVSELAEEAKETQMKVDATTELHDSVTAAVDHIEENLATAGKRLKSETKDQPPPQSP